MIELDNKIEFQDFKFNSIESFQFLQVPRVLLTNDYFKDLSIDAVMLYTLLLDTYKLSTKNNWRDENGRVYIRFTIKRIEEFLRCGNQKAIKVLRELDDESGIGLITIRKQEKGLPNLIYVKDFNNAELFTYKSQKEYAEKDFNNLESSVKITPPSSVKITYPTSVKITQGVCENHTGVVWKSHSNNNNNNNNNSNNEYNTSKSPIPYKEIMDYLNQKVGSSYRHSANKNQALIKARWNEGNNLDDFKKAIDVKTKEWLQDETMKKYLRPSTLFGNKFDEYRNQYIRTNTNKERSVGDDYESFAEKARKERIEKQKKARDEMEFAQKVKRHREKEMERLRKGEINE